jgi:hypothetical protein
MVLAVIAGCVAWVGCEYVVAEPVRVFSPYGGGYAAGAVLSALAGCYAAVRIAGRPDAFVPFATAIAAGMIMAVAFVTVAAGVLRYQYGEIDPSSISPLLTAGSGFALIASYRSALHYVGAGRLRALLLAAIPLGALFLYGQTPHLPIWYTQQPVDGDWGAYARIDVETTYYDQYWLMRSALDRLEKQRPGTTDLYFIGFAGDASQDVFRKEVGSVGRLFDERFDAVGRSVQLINNPATVTETALANRSNLSYALEEIGGIMDTEEDVLFLFLTSHGSKGMLAVNFRPLGLNNLTAGDLRGMLDEAGIKWRVIVVSACYSGSLIDELRTEHSLIITAADKDRTSFGCGDEFDFTYFGRAFFDEALRGTFSFIDAFAEASKSIAERERSEGLPPSQPQMAVGGAILPKLAALRYR